MTTNELIEKLQKGELTILNGEWYIFTTHGGDMRSFGEREGMKTVGHTPEGMIRRGWTATPIVVLGAKETEPPALGVSVKEVLDLSDRLG